MSTKAVSKILVTGSKGFIGSELISYLTNKGYDVIGVDVDIRDIEALRPHFKNRTFVIHAAGKVKKGIPNQQDYYSINVLGTKNVIGLCLENGLNLIHLGSVVGQKPFSEEVAYCISKLASQNLVEDYSLHKGLKAVILKLCVIYNKENNTGRHGSRYPIGKLSEDVENIINYHNFSNYILADYSNIRA